MRILYAAVINGVAVSAAQDIIQITAPADAMVRLDHIFLGQYTDFQDAEDELVPIEFTRGYTDTQGGSAVTPRPYHSRAAASAATVTRNETSEANTGTAHTLISETFNVRAGYIWKAPAREYGETQEEYLHRSITLDVSEMGVLNIGAPADAFTVNLTFGFEELR